jgi:hypothetical protein
MVINKQDKTTKKGLQAAAKRYDFEVASAPETAKVDPLIDQPQPLPQLDAMPVKRQPQAVVLPPTRAIPYRRGR